ncbi:MAG: DUF503 domain-containing protein [Chloroflexi bacterium HGW-Chloroflexi-2]|jgi:uncharacterized protein YlxP (DUF503 family)|nr:MAG: DUF503 domain-containing protein [Chloroflexi bacterium HGW-Chloroflexi-2]
MALCYIEIKIDIPFAQNLKDKRSILTSITSRISKKFNVSIAEIDFNDVWKSAKLGMAIISQNGRVFDSMIESIIEYIETTYPEIRVSITHKELL